MTHVMVAMLRDLGIPARYVSGYLYPSTRIEPEVTIAGESHAWVEYFAGEWCGIDPTNGLRETTRHVTVARGRDYDDVPPLKGVYDGTGSTRLGVVVEMTVRSA
jgi:transglutaminase-like putative cysteine protease